MICSDDGFGFGFVSVIVSDDGFGSGFVSIIVSDDGFVSAFVPIISDGSGFVSIVGDSFGFVFDRGQFQFRFDQKRFWFSNDRRHSSISFWVVDRFNLVSIGRGFGYISIDDRFQSPFDRWLQFCFDWRRVQFRFDRLPRRGPAAGRGVTYVEQSPLLKSAQPLF